MNYTLQIHGERMLYQVPPGLYELMSDISREVLRDQPEQVYQYIANFLDTLLNLRTNMKKALEVVDDVIADNKELFAYVDAIGTTWEEANKYARVIQRTFRTFKARRELRERARAEKEEQLGQLPFAEHSPSFIEYFESLGVDYDTANKASLAIQSAFKTYMARKDMRQMVKCSTHTIDMIAPTVDVPLVMEKPTTRDSKLLTYEESRSPSINSGWYKPLTDESTKTLKEKKSVASSTLSYGLDQKRPFTRDSKLLVYEQSPRPSIESAWYATLRKGTDVSMEARRLGLYKGMSFLEREDVSARSSRAIPTPTLETPLPTYFNADQSKVPMISRTGQLDVLEEDVVTLFSTDTFKVSKSFVGSARSDHSQKEKVEKLPSLNDLGRKSSKTESETAKELYSIIEKKSSVNEKLIDTTESLRSGSKADKTSILTRVSRLSRSQKSEDDKAIPSDKPSITSQRTGSLHTRKSSSKTSATRVKLLDVNETLEQ